MNLRAPSYRSLGATAAAVRYGSANLLAVRQLAGIGKSAGAERVQAREPAAWPSLQPGATRIYRLAEFARVYVEIWTISLSLTDGWPTYWPRRQKVNAPRHR